jgi:hypothetical protein
MVQEKGCGGVFWGVHGLLGVIAPAQQTVWAKFKGR